MPRLYRRILWVLVGLAGFVLGLLLVRNLAGLPAPQLDSKGNEISSAGPLRFIFSEPVNEESAESRFSIAPAVKGRFQWTSQGTPPEQVLLFWPDEPLRPGLAFTIRIDAGVTGQNGLILRRQAVWNVKVREPEILFLSPIDQPEIWRVKAPGQPPRQITFTGGKVFDYQAAPDGSKIIFSARNSQNGLDLWEVDRDGGQSTLLLPCQSDWCNNPAYSPAGTQLAYSRRQMMVKESPEPGAPRIWLLDLTTMATERLYNDPNVGGFEPVWSPDGKFLSFFDGLAGGVRIINLKTRADFLLPSQMGMSARWSPDSQKTLFTEYVETDAEPNIRVFQVDVDTQEIRRVLGETPEAMDYSLPEWNPDGEWVAVALRPMTGSASKQIFLMRLDGSDAQAITADQLYTNTSCRWDPGGNWLLFQRLKIGASDQKPEVMLWDQQDRSIGVAAEDAFLAAWLP